MLAHHASGKGIAPAGQVGPLPRGQSQVGDVADPDLVRRSGSRPGGEFIGRGHGLWVSLGGARGPGTGAGAE
ncbi:MAG: hypothetical protein EOO61_16605, partial [Hymenobacter sp.]